MAAPPDAKPRRKEVYTYEAPFPVYGLACSQRPGAAYNFRFAIGSFIEEYSNKVQVRREGGGWVGWARRLRRGPPPTRGAVRLTVPTVSRPPVRVRVCVQIIQVDDDKNEIVGRAMFDHPYPATKILWAPEAVSGGVGGKDLLATAGDYLRLWTVQADNEVRFEAVFNNVRGRAGAGVRVCGAGNGEGGERR
jgi:WD repeat-containing protein 68